MTDNGSGADIIEFKDKKSRARAGQDLRSERASDKGRGKNKSAKKPSHWFNIGTVIFGLIFIYLIATLIIYVTSAHIAPYEVLKGSVLKNTTFRGLAVREEKVSRAAADGYVNYFTEDLSKIKAGERVCLVTDEKLLPDKEASSKESSDPESADGDASEAGESSDTERYREETAETEKFLFDFDESSFYKVYDFKDLVTALLGSEQKAALAGMLADETNGGAGIYPAEEDGIFVKAVDGLEDCSADTVTADIISPDKYQSREVTENRKVSAGDAVYKVITSENWQIVLLPDAKTARALKDMDSVRVNLLKDRETLIASLKVDKRDGRDIAVLNFNDSMIRYAKDRYLDVELVLEDMSGLKIPKSAVTGKDFYEISASYVTDKDKNVLDSVRVVSKDEEGREVVSEISASIYYPDSESDTAYLDPDEISGTVLPPKDGDEDTPFKLSAKKKLKGVYCVNKGYAVFRHIQILGENENFYIVKTGTDYGLSLYDHIAPDASKLKEDDLAF